MSALNQYPRSKTPNGVDVARRIVVALMPAEREAFDELARRESRTSSSMARLLMLRAIEADTEAKSLLDAARAKEAA